MSQHPPHSGTIPGSGCNTAHRQTPFLLRRVVRKDKAVRPADISRLSGLSLLQSLSGRRLLDPVGKSSFNMGNIGHAHILQGLGRQRAAPASATEQHKLLALIAKIGLK